MRVLIFHGYLLRGTGSNIYNANVARALARLGHEVHLVCQERHADELEWPSGPGSVTVHNPDIGGLLPVYVHDRYEGFEVKTFPELSEAELDAYIAANADAVRDVAEQVGGVDAALANHLIMGPLICARAGLRFAAKIHGSALEYTVKPNPRFLPHAREGMNAATAVLAGSRHTAESLWAALPDHGELEAKTRLGPPGVDTDEFSPRDPDQAGTALERLADLLESGEEKDAFGRDRAAAASALRHLAAAQGPRVIFVGKLIVSKGVDLLAAAWPLVHAANPGARLLIVGFGAFEDGLRELIAALDRGDLEAALAVAEAGRALEGGEPGPLPHLGAFLSDPPPGYADAARAAAGSVSISGRLEHDEVAAAVPSAEALVMPSTFPESFGMVAAEAAAAGVLPVSAGHSGMAEVSGALAAALSAEAAPLVSFPVDDGAVAAIADRLNRWLALDPQTRAAARDALVSTARERWSWEGVAKGILAASAGELDALARP